MTTNDDLDELSKLDHMGTNTHANYGKNWGVYASYKQTNSTQEYKMMDIKL